MLTIIKRLRSVPNVILLNNQTLEEYYIWNSEKKQLLGDGKGIYAYDANGNQTLEEYYRWDYDKNQWKGFYKYIYAYDANGNEVFLEHYEWDSEKNQWVGLANLRDTPKYIRAYDANGNLTLDEYYIWAYWGVNGWIGAEKFVYEYDAYGNKTLEEWYSLGSWETTEWALLSIAHYYYTLRDLWQIAVEETQIDEASEMRCRVSGGMLTVVPAAEGVATVYTMSGSVVAAVAANAGQQIEIVLPARGVYIVKTAAGTAKVVW